jgi:very-short-patch-repair endonuclease
MTLAEKKLWAVLRKRGLNIRRQAPIGRYIADFASHGACLVIEIDGPLHDLPDENLRDAERTFWLNSQGYQVIRFRNLAVLNDPIGVADQIEAAITGKALPLDGGGLGGGVSAEMKEGPRSAPNAPFPGIAVRTPPTPTLPPSRGKGEDE